MTCYIICIVAPDRFLSCDVCLGGNHQACIAMGFAAVWLEGPARTCASGVGFKLFQKADVFLNYEHNGNKIFKVCCT